MPLQIEDLTVLNNVTVKLLIHSDDITKGVDISILNNQEKEYFKEIKSQKRKAEFYFTRKLWKDFNLDSSIFYDDLGRPQILDHGHISISHSKNVVAIAHHLNHFVGIDVEHYQPKIKLIAKKFLSNEDLLNDKSIENLPLAWSLKEAVYKMERIPGLSFKENIHVNVNDEKAEVTVLKDQARHHYSFYHKKFDDFILTCCSHANFNGKILF